MQISSQKSVFQFCRDMNAGVDDTVEVFLRPQLAQVHRSISVIHQPTPLVSNHSATPLRSFTHK